MINLDVRQFQTSAAFNTYLNTLVAPTWFTKVAIHHTVVPTIDQWRGLTSMRGMISYYQGLGWDGTPHLFIAPDGIWIMNDLTKRGVHTNAANSFAIAIEVVGNYDHGVWKDPIYTYTLDTIRHLQTWNNLQTTDIVLHRTYNPTKTCPGKAITYPWIIEQLQKQQELEAITYRVRYNNSYIREGPSRSYKVVGPKLQKGDIFISTAIKKDEKNEKINGLDTWSHVTHAVQTAENVEDAGFVHSSMLERV